MYTLEEPYVVIAEPSEKSKELHTMTKWCYLVAGVEGSGNYMFRNALIAAGCYHDPKLDTITDDPYEYEFEDLPDNLVFHRSIPHGNEREYFPLLLACLGDGGYKVHVISIMRDPNATAKSASRRKEVSSYYDSFIECVQFSRTLAGILDWCEDHTPITYEAFVTSEGFRRWLFEERLGLPYPEDFEVYNANEQYYD